MCGISGIFSYHHAAGGVDREENRLIRDYMINRGPDGSGEWYSSDGKLGLGHRRLSIIDLSERAAQPMVSADGNLVITFNGEIYNYKALRKNLQTQGRVFRSQSDTEVLLHLYDLKGEDMVHDLRGMFSFGLWDARKNALLLARDPYGIKPLYYSDDGLTLRFASQVKALLAGGRISPAREPAGIAGFFLYGFVPEPYTIWKEIRSVPAGSYVWCTENSLMSPKPYISIADIYRRAEKENCLKSSQEVQESIREILVDSVRHHLVADVEVGAFLSAGVDSSSLVALIEDVRKEDRSREFGTAQNNRTHTITIAFEEFRGTNDDESRHAESVSRYYGTEHRTRTVTKAEFEADFPKIMAAMDQPTLDGVNTWFVSKCAKEAGLKVAISGLGGDELFGGYESFRTMPEWVKWNSILPRVKFAGELFRVAHSGMRSIARLNQKLYRSSWMHPKTTGLVSLAHTYPGAYLVRRGVFMPWELNKLMGRDLAKAGLERLNPVLALQTVLAPEPQTAFGKIATLESCVYMKNQLLRDTDWASMAHSLEVRTPLVDIEVLRNVAPYTVSGKEQRPKKYYYESILTETSGDLLSRNRTGFSVPLEKWVNWSAPGAFSWIPRVSPDNHWPRKWASIVAACFLHEATDLLPSST